MTRLIVLFVCVAQIALAGCAQVSGIMKKPPEVRASAMSAEYQLGPADKMRVLVFDEPNLSGEFVVSGAGQVSYPLVGDVMAQGLTVAEFQGELQSRLAAGYLRDPRVSVEVLAYRPFYILGEVNKPGQYPFTDDLTVLNAVAGASGFTYRANTKRIFIRHAGSAAETEYTLTSTTPVLPGDTIRVAERFF
ncbi:polysaccharide biosynthesis/export family protein [Caulobacter sp. 17J80-11]|uniref:polysaccharide biosynthesis/export family protein n=1 Tax=Caulobacter sp. 17J80-11 TaxID=2763502 RepID=UPI001653BA7B|nr:polysaccharide biosynthesis/export family protein [Caulobacter sp. 17J80-11]MBC6983545.1 polysaccharide export protein [Caulobacter sp. 17J80-11]